MSDRRDDDGSAKRDGAHVTVGKTDPLDPDFRSSHESRRGATSPEPTPAALREWADWFDDPTNRAVILRELPRSLMAGYLLRRIADEMEASRAAGESKDR